MTPDQERWAEALQVHKQHGDQAPAFVAARIGALILQGDMKGVNRWREIAGRLDQLLDATRQ